MINPIRCWYIRILKEEQIVTLRKLLAILKALRQKEWTQKKYIKDTIWSTSHLS